jgi:hypothetical protein
MQQALAWPLRSVQTSLFFDSLLDPTTRYYCPDKYLILVEKERQFVSNARPIRNFVTALRGGTCAQAPGRSFVVGWFSWLFDAQSVVGRLCCCGSDFEILNGWDDDE